MRSQAARCCCRPCFQGSRGDAFGSVPLRRIIPGVEAAPSDLRCSVHSPLRRPSAILRKTALSPARPARAFSSTPLPDAVGEPASRPTLLLVPRHTEGRGGDARLTSRLVPWIFRNEVANAEELRKLGHPALVVNVENSEGRELGAAICNLQKGGRHGTLNIFARLLAENANVRIDRGFFAARLQLALRHRKQSFGAGQDYRLFNAEGDLAPGIVCDRYGDVLCLQFTAAAMQLLLEQEVLEALDRVLQPKAIVLRCDPIADRKLEHAPMRAPAVVKGSYEAPVLLAERGFTYEADLMAEGWEQGRFFMERAQRAYLRQLIEGGALSGGGRTGGSKQRPRVLSLFGESLGIFCAQLGADAICATGLGPVTQPALEALARRNDCQDRVSYLRLEAAEAALLGGDLVGSCDLVTLEPPALAATYGRVEAGSQRYTAWVALAATALRPGGLLLFACRSRAMTAVRLLRCINLGLWSVRRRGRLVHRVASAGPDFPVHLALPDTNALQVFCVRLR